MGDTVGGVLRRGSDRIIAGVCAGLGDYFHLDHTLVRIVFVILALAPPGVGILLYLVLWFLMEAPGTGLPSPRTPGDRIRQMGEEFRREFWHQPARAQAGGDSPAASGGAPPPAPPAPGHHWGGRGQGGRPSGLWGGIILIALGAYFLLANLGYLSGFRWDLFWPVVLIAIGLLVFLRRFR